MARKRESTARREIYCIRISEKEKEFLRHNPILKKDLDNYVRMFLDAFITSSKE